jgi:hypothetical protein
MRKFLLAAAALACAVSLSLLSAGRSEAAPLSPAPAGGALTLETLVQDVQARCVLANVQCRARFGGGPDYRFCMRRRGCGIREDRFRRCNVVERRCRNRFGRGPDFRRCMRP